MLHEKLQSVCHRLQDPVPTIVAWSEKGYPPDTKLAPETLCDLYCHLQIMEALPPLQHYFASLDREKVLELVLSKRYAPLHHHLLPRLSPSQLLVNLGAQDLSCASIRPTVKSELSALTPKALLDLYEKKHSGLSTWIEDEILHLLTPFMLDKDFAGLTTQRLDPGSMKHLLRLLSLYAHRRDPGQAFAECAVGARWTPHLETEAWVLSQGSSPYAKCMQVRCGCMVDEKAWKREWYASNQVPYLYTCSDQKADLQTILQTFAPFLHQNQLVWLTMQNDDTDMPTVILSDPLNVKTWKKEESGRGGARQWTSSKCRLTWGEEVKRWIILQEWPWSGPWELQTDVCCD